MHRPLPNRRAFLRGGLVSLAALAGVPLLPRAALAAGVDHPVPCCLDRYFFSAEIVIIVAMRSAPFVS